MSNKIKGMLTSNSNEWETPQDLFDRLNRIFHFDIDVAANDENHKCEKYFTKERDGLTQNWGGYSVWCNPPYGKEIGKWVQKAAETVEDNETVIVMLIPSRTDTRWFHDYILNNPRATIHFIKGRLRFSGSSIGAPFPSMVVVFA